MAERIKQSEFSGLSRYPWSEWTDGTPWRAKKGEDFSCSLDGFRAGLYNRAKAMGVKVRARTSGESIEFQFDTGS